MRPLALLVALALLPTAFAAWQSSALAPAEPSTPFDDDAHMFQEAPLASDRHLYLDLRYTPASALNPLPHFEALLGVWSDCDRDGVIGSYLYGDTYQASLLLDDSVCPSIDRHNDGVTVRELLWVGPGAAYPHYDDPYALVWVDALYPGEHAPTTKTSVDDALQFVPAAPRWVGSALFVPEPAHATAYAYLGPAVFAEGAQAPSAFTHAYGAPNCPPGGPSLNNWECDAAAWSGAIRVGQAYHLRDVDCTSPCP